MKNKLVILTGPTAVGKTSLSIRLAKEIGGEIISADCMQVYKHMDIGTAKITREEMHGVPHHLIDCIEPTDDFNVVLFVKMALEAMDDIYSRGHIPIICGGTGFYIQALLYDISFEEMDADLSLREELENFAKYNGNDALLEKLREIDPESANTIPANNVKRVIRAIEYFQQTGQKISDHNIEQRQKESPYDFCYFVLNDNRELLYRRINQRVDIMMNNGLLNEVQMLLETGIPRDAIALDGIGYKEILSYLDGNCTLDEAVDMVKQNSRRYAKRQLTWFRRERDVIWLDKSQLKSEDIILGTIKKHLIERGIIFA